MNDTSPIECQLRQVSGKSPKDCVILGRRFSSEVGPVSTECDYWILANVAESESVTTTYAIWSFRSFITGIWRSPAETVYATDADLGGLYMFRDVRDTSTPPTRIELGDVSPEGIWGLNDDCIFVWGTRRDAQRQLHHLVFQYDGAGWRELPALSRPCVSIHGVAPDLAYAVGYHGLVARWDGRAWTDLPTPTQAVVSDVHVESPDELYAVTLDGELLEGSGSGLDYGGRNPIGASPFSSVAKFEGEVYIGANDVGLMKRAPGGASVVEFKPNIGAVHMEKREALLIACDTRVCGSVDGQNFFSTARDKFPALTAGKPIPPL